MENPLGTSNFTTKRSKHAIPDKFWSLISPSLHGVPHVVETV